MAETTERTKPWHVELPDIATIGGHEHMVWDINDGETGMAVVILPMGQDSKKNRKQRAAIAARIVADHNAVEATGGDAAVLPEALDALLALYQTAPSPVDGKVDLNAVAAAIRGAGLVLRRVGRLP